MMQLGIELCAARHVGHGTARIEDFIEQFERMAVARGVRPRSIAVAKRAFRRIAHEMGARREGDLTSSGVQTWMRSAAGVH